ncbi:unnamed protein product [Rangifer tarandus platyrhynchus]|uniref:Uncharacterized protein n=1 Tax=Rangifer tarandus platyrhynchus TaxID=3082113 RepID=A0AC59ZNI8_RANTA
MLFYLKPPSTRASQVKEPACQYRRDRNWIAWTIRSHRGNVHSLRTASRCRMMEAKVGLGPLSRWTFCRSPSSSLRSLRWPVEPLCPASLCFFCSFPGLLI